MYYRCTFADVFNKFLHFSEVSAVHTYRYAVVSDARCGGRPVTDALHCHRANSSSKKGMESINKKKYCYFKLQMMKMYFVTIFFNNNISCINVKNSCRNVNLSYHNLKS